MDVQLYIFINGAWQEYNPKPAAHNHTISEVTGLQTALNLKANDNQVVKVSGDQTIAGVKTFNDGIIIPGSNKYIDLGNKNNWFWTRFSGENWTFNNTYTGGGWARNLMEMKDAEGNAYLRIGAQGNSQTFTHMYIGPAYSNYWLSLNNTRALFRAKPQYASDPTADNDLTRKKYVDDELNDKVDKDGSKVLSTNDYTTAEKNKLAGIETGAQVNVGTNLSQGARDTATLRIDSSTGDNFYLPAVTTSLAGLMTSADKSKLNGIETGAQKNSDITKAEIETSLGYTPENAANKITSIRTNATDTAYVSELGVKTYVDGLIGSVYRPFGNWSASTNTPTLANNTPANTGKVYRVGTAGTQFGLTFAIGDKLAFIEGGVATKWDNVDDVTSVNGKTGTVVLTAEDVGAAPTGQVVRATTENKNILGTTEGVFNISEKKVWFNKGALFYGTAAAAGLVTRGISGVNSSGSAKDHLYINYDGTNTLSRQLVLGAGSTGDSRGYGIYDYSAVRGDAFIAYLTNTLGSYAKTITGAASTIASSDLTKNRALIANGSGKVAVSPATSTELGYLSGVTSSIQTQLSNKANDDDVVKLTTSGSTIQNIDSRIDISNTSIPFYSTRKTTVNGGIYATAMFTREITTGTPADGNGPGVYFRASSSTRAITHAGIFGGRLAVATQGAEVGEIVLGPAWRGADPYQRADFRVRARSASIADAYINGKFYAENTKEVATQEWVTSNTRSSSWTPTYTDITGLTANKVLGRTTGTGEAEAIDTVNINQIKVSDLDDGNSYAKTADLPTKVSDLTNDAGYTTNKGTVTQVRVNNTNYNPNSAGQVNLPAYPIVPTYTSSTSITLSGTSFQRAALTGDVTASANSNTTTIKDSAVTTNKINDNAVTLAKIQNIGSQTVLGNATSNTDAVTTIPLINIDELDLVETSDLSNYATTTELTSGLAGKSSWTEVWSGSVNLWSYRSSYYSATVPSNSYLGKRIAIEVQYGTVTAYTSKIIFGVLGSNSTTASSTSISRGIGWSYFDGTNLRVKTLYAYTSTGNTTTISVGHLKTLFGSFSGSTIEWSTSYNETLYMKKIWVIE